MDFMSGRHKSRLYLANALIWLAMGIGLVVLGVWSWQSLTDTNALALLLPMAIVFTAFKYLLDFLFRRNVRRIESSKQILPFAKMMDVASASVLLLFVLLTIIFSPYDETWAYSMTITMLGCGLAAFNPAVRYIIKSLTNNKR